MAIPFKTIRQANLLYRKTFYVDNGVPGGSGEVNVSEESGGLTKGHFQKANIKRNASRLAILLIPIFIILLFPISPGYAAPGDLDPTFGNGGLVLGPHNAEAYAAAPLPDGKLIVAGGSFSWVYDFDYGGYLWQPGFGVVIARYNSNGSLDTTFGTGGIVEAEFFHSAVDVAIQADEKVVVASGGNTGLGIARFNPDGSLDTTFGGDGIVFTNTLGARSGFKSIAIQPDGKIVAAGYSGQFVYVDGSPVLGDDFILLRYSPDGSLDTTFDGDGIVTTDIGSTFEDYDNAQSVVIQPDGKILAVGHARTGTFPTFFDNRTLVRYNPNGSLDATFDGDGIVTTNIGQSGQWTESVAIQPDGRIIEASCQGLVRYNANGSLDTSFDGDGFVTPQGARRIAIQPDGKIVGAGCAGLVRYNTNGSLDTDFGGGDGISIVDFGGENSISHDLMLDGQGHAVVVGSLGYDDPQGPQIAFARFLLNPVATEVSVSGRVMTSNGRGLGNAIVSFTDSLGVRRTARTSAFGYYSFANIPEDTYNIAVRSKRYQFVPRTLFIDANLSGVDFVPMK